MRKLTPWLQDLEGRVVLSMVDWNTTVAPTGGNWDTGSNWDGGSVPGPSQTAVIKGLTSPGIVSLTSGNADSVASLVTDSTVTLDVVDGSLSLGGAATSTLGGAVTVSAGASMSVGASATVQIGAGQTFTDDGTVSFTSDDTVQFSSDCCPTSQSIVVNGTLTAEDTTFTSTGGGSEVAVSSGGTITPSQSTFGVTVAVPFNDVAALASGSNVSFDQIDIISETIPGGDSLDLNAIGSNASSLSYVFPAAFTISSGATVSVGSDVNVSIGEGQTLTDDGTLSFASGDTVTLDSECCPSSQSIDVGGTLTADDTTFTSTGGGSEVSVSAGGTITPSGSSFDVPLYVPYNDVAALASGSNVSFDQIEIISETIPGGDSVDLNAIGSNTSSLSYVFPAAFTVSSGATVAVGPDVNVSIGEGQTFTDDGTVSFASGDTVTLDSECCPSSQSIDVGGTLTADDTTFTSTGGGSEVSVSAGGTITPSGSSFDVPLYVPYNDVAALASGSNVSFDQVEIIADTLPGGSNLDLNAIGSNTSGLSYVFSGAFTVAAGATVAVGPNVNVYIGAGLTFTDNGTVSFANDDIVTLNSGCCPTSQSIDVGGTLTADGTTFTSTGGGSEVSVGSGGTITPSQSSFEVPLYVPYNDVAALASGSNVGFDQIEIIAGTLANGSNLDLNAIGSNTSGLSYVFSGAFTVAAGATVAVGPNVNVYIGAGLTFTDNGTVSFADDDTVTLNSGCCPTSQSLDVGGTLTAVGTTFTTTGAGSEVSVSSTGIITPSQSSFDLPLYVPYNDVAALASGSNVSFDQIEIIAGTMPGGSDLDLDEIGTTAVSLSYVFTGAFTIESGATVAVGTDVPVYIGAGQTFTDDGSLTFASGDTVTFNVGCCDTSQSMVVGGTLTADGTTFNDTAAGGVSDLNIGSGGNIQASDSTFSITELSISNGAVYESGDLTGNVFNMPIYVPYEDLQYLGGNTSFNQIAFNTGSLATGTLDLDPIGTNITSLSYGFAGAFTIESGTTVAVGPDVAVYVLAGQTVTDDGAVTFSTGDSLTFDVGCCDTSQSVVVGGSLTAEGTTFSDTNSGGGSTISVNYGGDIAIASSTYSLNDLILNSGSTASMTVVSFSSIFKINAGANLGTQNDPTVTGNDFSNVPNNGIVPSGNSAGTIQLGGNYWGTTVASQIEAKIDDYGNSNYPTVNFSPYISNTTGTSASPVSATFNSTSSQEIELTASVTTSPTSQVIDVGTETFTIYDGTQVIGDPTSAVQVSNGSATATFDLPADTPSDDYTIDAYYSGYYNAGNDVSYLPASDTSHFLTIGPGATSTSVSSAAATFNASSDQSIPLTATVSSTAGAINEGIVTFTILQGDTPVGSSVSETVTNNQAMATYDLLAGTAGGTYTIQAVYTDPADYSTSTGTNVLTVSAASTSVTPADASTTYNGIASEGYSLSAAVDSTTGTVNQGSVTFQILTGSGTKIGSPITVNVSDGIASQNATLPAATPPGSYVIDAVFNGTPSYAASLLASSTLTVTGAATATAASNATTGYSASAQSVAVTATVTSPAGTVGSGAVTFTILNNGLTVGSPVNANVSAGVASTTYVLPAGEAIGTYTIDAVFNGTTYFTSSSDISHTLSITQPPATQLVIETPPSSSSTAGQSFQTQPVIYEEDQNGDLVTGDNSTVVTASLASGTGPLVGTFTATVVGGIATFTNLGDNTAETITLKFSSGNLTPAFSSSIKISPAGASQLVVTQQPSSTATAGQAFATQPVVKEEDLYGNVITSDSTSTVTVSRGSVGSGTFVPSTVTLSSGVATFTGLSYTKAEIMNLAFTSSSSGVSSIDSNDITVSPAKASQLIIEQGPPTSATAGQPFSTQPVIYEEDAYNNLESGDDTSVVTAVLDSGSGPLTGTTATVSGGVARFTSLADSAVETITLGFTSGTLSSVPSNSVTVSPGPVAKLVIHTEPSTSATAGQAFAVQPVVYLEDASGNLETSDNASTVTVSLASGTGPLVVGSTTVTVKGGIATFANLTDDTAETITLKFSSDSLSVGPSTSITVSPAALFRLAIATQPSTSATAGQAFPTQPVIDELDEYGNLESGDDSTVITASLASGNGPLVAGTTTATVSGGVATFTGLADDVTGTISLSFAEGQLSVGPSDAITINPGQAAQLVITTQPIANVTAGNPLTDPIVLDELDRFGNLVTTDNSTVVTASLSTGSGTLTGTMTATVVGGVATFNDLEDNTAGTLTLQFTAPNLPAVISSSSTVSPASASTLAIKRPPAGVISGTAFPLEVDAMDPIGNVATSFNSAVTVGLAGGTGTLSGTVTTDAADGVAMFNNLVSTTSGSISLVASSTTTSSSQPTSPIPVTPSTPSLLVIQMQPSQTATAGVAFGTQPVVYEEDQYGNLETADNSTVVTAYLSSGSGGLGGTVTATVSGGIATFTNLSDSTAQPIALSFSGNGLTSVPSDPIVVSPAAASKLVIAQEPSTTAVVHQPFSTQPVSRGRRQVRQRGNRRRHHGADHDTRLRDGRPGGRDVDHPEWWRRCILRPFRQLDGHHHAAIRRRRLDLRRDHVDRRQPCPCRQAGHRDPASRRRQKPACRLRPSR